MLDSPRIYTFGDFKVDGLKQAVERLSDGSPVKLGPMARRLLLYLLQQRIARPAQVISREELLAEVWRAARGPDAIEFQVGQITKALGKQWIVCQGGGYYFCGDVLMEPCVSARAVLGDLPDHTQYFIGREVELDLLAALFHPEKLASVRCVLTGGAGVGKTELALQCTFLLRRRRTHPGGIFWLNGRSTGVRAQLADSVGERLGFPYGNPADRAAAVTRYLESTEQRALVVLDSAEGTEGLPRAPHIDWLLTARSWRSDATMRPIPVGPLSQHEASTLIVDLAGRDVNPGLKELIEHCEGHALLLHQAGTFLRANDMTAREWIDAQAERS